MTKETSLIESLKHHWRRAMKDREDAIKRVNYFGDWIDRERKKIDEESLKE